MTIFRHGRKVNFERVAVNSDFAFANLVLLGFVQWLLVTCFVPRVRVESVGEVTNELVEEDSMWFVASL